MSNKEAKIFNKTPGNSTLGHTIYFLKVSKKSHVGSKKLTFPNHFLREKCKIRNMAWGKGDNKSFELGTFSHGSSRNHYYPFCLKFFL